MSTRRECYSCMLIRHQLDLPAAGQGCPPLVTCQSIHLPRYDTIAEFDRADGCILRPTHLKCLLSTLGAVEFCHWYSLFMLLDEVTFPPSRPSASPLPLS